MCTLILPFIISLLLIFYCIFNINTKYNIIYILWVSFSLIPILNWFMIIIFPSFIMGKIVIDCETQIFSLKPTKLNKFLFDYEERKD